MLQEVYIMQHGVDIFHYSVSKNRSEDDFILTSGFFSALQSFAAEVRSSEIDFFSSSEEIFMFDDFIEEKDMQIVMIFQNDIQQSVAREVLNQVKTVLQLSEIKDLKEGHQLDRKTEERLRAQIDGIASSLLDVEFQIAAAEDLIGDYPGVLQLLIYDYYNDELHYSHVREDLKYDEDEELLALRNLQRNIIPLIKQCNIGKNFDLLVIDGFDYILVIYKYSTNFTVILAERSTTKSVILDLPFKILSLYGFDTFESRFIAMEPKVLYEIDKVDHIQLKKGGTALFVSDSKMLKTIDAVDRLVASLNMDEYTELILYPEAEADGYFRMTRNHTRGTKQFEIFT